MPATLSLVRKTLCLAKTEVTPGTAEASLAASAATPDTTLLFGTGTIFQLQQKNIDKPVLSTSLTPQKQLAGRRLYSINPQTVLMSKGAGGAGGFPWFAPFLKACGLAEVAAGTVTSGQTGSWTYTPVSTSFKSCTTWIYADGILHKIGGCLGTFSLDLKAGEAPDLSFDLQGFLAAEPAGNTANPSPVTLPTNNMKIVESLGMTIGSYTPVARSVKFTQGMGRTERGDVNSPSGFKGIHLPSRQGMLELQIEREIDTTTMNFYNLQKTASVANAISFTHGADSQSAILFSATQPQLLDITEGDDGGIATWNLKYMIGNTTADSDFSLAFKEKNP